MWVVMNFLNFIYIYKIEIRNSETYLPEVSISSIMACRPECIILLLYSDIILCRLHYSMHKKFHLNCIHIKLRRDWWDIWQIQKFTAQRLMGYFCVGICQSECLIIKRKSILAHQSLCGKFLNLSHVPSISAEYIRVSINLTVTS